MMSLPTLRGIASSTDQGLFRSDAYEAVLRQLAFQQMHHAVLHEPLQRPRLLGRIRALLGGLRSSAWTAWRLRSQGAAVS